MASASAATAAANSEEARVLKEAAATAISESCTTGRISQAEAAAVLEDVRGGVDKAFGMRHESDALDRNEPSQVLDRDGLGSPPVTFAPELGE
jgi:hypothetical protein